MSTGTESWPVLIAQWQARMRLKPDPPRPVPEPEGFQSELALELGPPLTAAAVWERLVYTEERRLKLLHAAWS